MNSLSPRIYLLEDNLVFQTLVVKQLENISQDIRVFSTGETFLEAMTDQPDLVILDYHLEGTMNGYDVLKELKKRTDPPPVIFFSSNLELTITSSILKLGVVEYIEKTIFSMPRLKAGISKALKTLPA